MKKIEAVLFDLDGTLLDTANDLAHALNCTLSERQLDTIPEESLRSSAGKGSKGLLKAALNMDETHVDFPNLSKELFSHYEKHALRTTQLFEGMDKVLDFLDGKNIPWGIVTNKPTLFTHPILEGLLLSPRAGCIVCGDTLAKAKPHPDPILHGCSLLGVEPSNCLYVGDSEIDMLASRAAGTVSILALYGYIEGHETPEFWDMDGRITRPEELLSWFEPVKP